MEKTYVVQVEGTPSDAQLQALRAGVHLNDGATLPARARQVDEPLMLWERTPPVRVRRNIPTSWLELCITEGRIRQVRRMTTAVGLPCQRLIRMAIGPYDLEGLAPGTFGWVARHCVIGVRSFIDVSLCFRSMNLNFMDGRPFDSLSP